MLVSGVMYHRSGVEHWTLDPSWLVSFQHSCLNPQQTLDLQFDSLLEMEVLELARMCRQLFTDSIQQGALTPGMTYVELLRTVPHVTGARLELIRGLLNIPSTRAANMDLSTMLQNALELKQTTPKNTRTFWLSQFTGPNFNDTVTCWLEFWQVHDISVSEFAFIQTPTYSTGNSRLKESLKQAIAEDLWLVTLLKRLATTLQDAVSTTTCNATSA
jgi:hypothetical protein